MEGRLRQLEHEHSNGRLVGCGEEAHTAPTADNSTPTAARLRLAPFGYGPLARPVACEALYELLPLFQG